MSFSGGKDSTVLLHIVCKTLQEIINDKILKHNFIITPSYAYEVTFPETISFIKKICSSYKEEFSFVNDLYLAKPKMSWNDILNNKGYPIFSKQQSVILNRIKNVKSKNSLTRWIFKINTSRYGLAYNRLFLLDKKMEIFSKYKGIDEEYFGKTLYEPYKYSEKCCDYIKGGLKHINKPTFIGTMASESELRKNSWIRYGCNIINDKKPVSRPLSIWRPIDVWKYIIKNKLEINEKYGFKQSDHFQEIVNNSNQLTFDINKNLDDKLNKTLKYKRLGCISCPYGSHIEQAKENLNRFEILKNESETLYQAQVIKNGMFKILINMGIKIRSDKEYMKLYEFRWKDIDEWYKNFDENLASIITQIENYGNYKKFDTTKKKYAKSVWNYEEDEILKIFKNYSFESNKSKILNLVNKYRKK